MIEDLALVVLLQCPLDDGLERFLEANLRLQVNEREPDVQLLTLFPEADSLDRPLAHLPRSLYLERLEEMSDVTQPHDRGVGGFEHQPVSME